MRPLSSGRGSHVPFTLGNEATNSLSECVEIRYKPGIAVLAAGGEIMKNLPAFRTTSGKRYVIWVMGLLVQSGITLVIRIVKKCAALFDAPVCLGGSFDVFQI